MSATQQQDAAEGSALAGAEHSIRDVANSWLVLAVLAVGVDIYGLSGIWPTPYLMLGGAIWLRQSRSVAAARFLLVMALVELLAWLISKLLIPVPSLGPLRGVVFTFASWFALRQARILNRIREQQEPVRT